MATVGTIATGSVAARLARLERALPREGDGAPLVMVFEDPDGGRDVRGTIGRDTLVVVLRVRQDGPQ
jgi:hypothetical protein